MTIPTSELSQLAFDALAHTVAGDTDRAADLLTTIGESAVTSQMYGVCCGIAEAGKHMLHQIYGDRSPRPDSEDMWVLEQIKPGALDYPIEAFSVRFLVAYCNGDKDSTLALFNALLDADPDTFVASVCALLADVAGICRLAIEQKRGGS